MYIVEINIKIEGDSIKEVFNTLKIHFKKLYKNDSHDNSAVKEGLISIHKCDGKSLYISSKYNDLIKNIEGEVLQIKETDHNSYYLLKRDISND